ncbi:hypothetical protein WJX81_004129 [Elliptochloris bilobata]|uniref:Uncharacterized protein n=1 Tax=Elliptochloris bilobata TaxID=381761 RepID=A0AAW1RIN5_9CHLO
MAVRHEMRAAATVLVFLGAACLLFGRVHPQAFLAQQRLHGGKATPLTRRLFFARGGGTAAGGGDGASLADGGMAFSLPDGTYFGDGSAMVQPSPVSAAPLQIVSLRSVAGAPVTLTASQSSWPALVGLQAQAVHDALAAATGLHVQLVQQGNAVTQDYNTNRIRVFFDPATGLVTQPFPRVG